MIETKQVEPKVKKYVNLEWSLVYIEEDGVLLLIFAKAEGNGKIDLRKTSTYVQCRNVEYKENGSTNLLLDVESSNGIR